MKLSPLRYERPVTLLEAAALLASRPEATLLAGGQSLVPALRLRERAASTLVDLGALTELRGVRRRADGHLDIGAAEPMATLERSAVVAEHAPLLPRVLGSVGAVGIRSRASLGGSLAWADPTSQLPATLVALDAQVVTTERSLSAEELLTGRHRTALQAGEIITRIVLPPAPGLGGFRLVRRTHITWPVLGAVGARPRGVDRLVVFGVASRPLSLSSRVREELIEELMERMEPFDDERATAAYRRQVAPVLACRALDELEAGA